MRTRSGLLLVVVATGCAAAQTPPFGPAAPPAATWAPWAILLRGETDAGAAALARRRRQEPGDRLAAWGAASLAHERVDSAEVLEGTLELLERTGGLVSPGRAGPTEGWSGAIAVASVSRLSVLLDEVRVRAAGEERALALLRARLPWPARLELARLGDGIARRRGDVALLARVAADAGCVTSVMHLGRVGRLPHVDLDSPAPPVEPRGVLPVSGCRLTVPSADGRPGVQVVRASFTVPTAGRYEVVLDSPAAALLTIDDGPPGAHGAEGTWGPRASAHAVVLAAGEHTATLRLGTWGGPAEVALLVAPEGPTWAPPSQGPPEAQAVGAVLALRAALLVGDTDRVLEEGEHLARWPGFGLALLARAAAASRDPSRPENMGRDDARELYRLALGVDGHDARAQLALAASDLGDERPREAAEGALRGARLAPGWWRPELTAWEALRQRGLERDADRALDRALEKGPAACVVLEAATRRARERRDLVAETRLGERVMACDASSDLLLDRLREKGDLAAALAEAERLARLQPERIDRAGDVAALQLAAGQSERAARTLAALVARQPHDAGLRLRQVDALSAAGDVAAAQRALGEALARRPDATDLRRAGRVAGLPMPLDSYRIDGQRVIADFEAAGRRAEAPAVLVLDRTVHRVLPDGTQILLTHNIVRAQSKAGVEKWGEVQVPEGAEILALRTRKADGSTREPEEIGGKDTVSAPDLSVGDYVEWETLETRPPSDIFPQGFLGERFYFRSFDLPLDRSEYVLVTPADMPIDVDARGPAPAARRQQPGDGTLVRTWAVTGSGQLYLERASVPPVEFVPSVRVSSGVTLTGWTRAVGEPLWGTARPSPALRRAAADLAAQVQAPAERARAVVRLVTRKIDAGGDMREPGSFALARGQGNRLALALALARLLDLPVRVLAARPLSTAAALAPTPAQELDDFSDTLLRFDLPGGPLDADLRHRFARPGMLGPLLDGVPALDVGAGRVVYLPRRAGGDGRKVRGTITVAADGSARGEIGEELTGWPAEEWAEGLDNFGGDRTRLRQEFEQRSLGLVFPGAALGSLEVTLRADGEEGAVVRYAFAGAQLGAVTGSELRVAPTPWRVQAGRRYAAEAGRATTLITGPEIPLDLELSVVLPEGARLVEPGRGGALPEAAPWFEERRVAVPGGVRLTRRVAVPFRRVPPSEYAPFADVLRRMDAIEQEEIRVRLP